METCFVCQESVWKLLHSSLEKTQMDLINICTLVFDIDAIVLHTNPNTVGKKKNHVLHIVISVSPFLMLKYTIYMYHLF